MSDSFTGQQINASVIRLTAAQWAAQWAAQPYVLPVGVIGIESDTGAYKIGDGATAWASLLAYSAPTGVKVYRALLTQTGTDAPVATVIENTLGGDVVWTRDSAGTYLGTLSNAFTDEKTLLYIQGYMGVTNWADGTNIQMFSLTRITSSLVKAESVFGTLGGTWAASDDLLVGQSVEILVYP